MYALGIHIDGEVLRAALVIKIKNKIQVEFTRTVNVKQFDTIWDGLQGKEAIIATGLEPTAMVRRETFLQLKTERAILRALPFQVETLIPYPADDMILVPRLYPNEQVLFATTKALLKTHLEYHQALGIDPEVVSATGVALSRWGKWNYPETENLCLMHQGCCVLTIGEKIATLQAYEHAERMKAFVLNKHPEANIVVVEDPYAIPIGLALDALSGSGLQLRRSSAKSEARKKKRMVKYAAACAALTLCIAGAGFYKTTSYEKKLTANINAVLGSSALSLSDRVADWEASLSAQRKMFPLAPTVPSVADLLAWLSSKKQEIDVVRLHYALVKYPKLGEGTEPYQAKVELEFNAPSPTTAREFHDALLKDDPFVNNKQEVSWSVEQNRYKTSFYLRSR
jgi:hypothetical protein